MDSVISKVLLSSKIEITMFLEATLTQCSFLDIQGQNEIYPVLHCLPV
jgi:hypothetical protein